MLCWTNWPTHVSQKKLQIFDEGCMSRKCSISLGHWSSTIYFLHFQTFYLRGVFVFFVFFWGGGVNVRDANLGFWESIQNLKRQRLG